MAFSRPHVVVSITDEEQEFQRYQAEDARATAQRLGYEVEVLFAGRSAVQQIQQLYSVLERSAEQRPQAVVLETVRGEGLERIAFAAAEAGIGWVVLNRTVDYLERLHRAAPQVPIATFGTITRPENRAMTRILEIEVEQIKPRAVEEFDMVAMVDTQPSFFEERLEEIDFVVDHHPEETPVRARLKDGELRVILNKIQERRGREILVPVDGEPPAQAPPA